MEPIGLDTGGPRRGEKLGRQAAAEFLLCPTGLSQPSIQFQHGIYIIYADRSPTSLPSQIPLQDLQQLLRFFFSDVMPTVQALPTQLHPFPAVSLPNPLDIPLVQRLDDTVSAPYDLKTGYG
jgi:hypothetical protein